MSNAFIIHPDHH